jgi:hypothetical protein
MREFLSQWFRRVSIPLLKTGLIGIDFLVESSLDWGHVDPPLSHLPIQLDLAS